MKKTTLFLIPLTIIATIVLAFVLFPGEKSPLFWFNTAYLCLLEGLLFGALYWISRRKNYNVPNVSMLYKVVQFAVWALVLMVVYGLLILADVSLDPRFYYAAQGVVALIYIIVIAYVNQGARHQTEFHETQKQMQRERVATRVSFASLSSLYASAIAGKGIEYAETEKGKAELNALISKTDMIPAANLAKAPEIAEELNNLLIVVKQALTQLRDSEGEAAQAQFAAARRTIQNTTADVEALKQQLSNRF